jgi:hypothetical protein
VTLALRNMAGAAAGAAYLRGIMTNPPPEAIASEILRQATVRGADKSICPSEVARALAGGDEAAWRPLMGKVRQAAVALAGAGQLEILRKGKPVPVDAVRGVIRLRVPGGTAEETAE